MVLDCESKMIMAYRRTGTRRRMSVLGAVESCGPNRQWDPNYDMSRYGLPNGQCTPKGSPMTPALKPVMASYYNPYPPRSGYRRAGKRYIINKSTGRYRRIGLGQAPGQPGTVEHLAHGCGPNQQWDPNYVFGGTTGQCTPRGSPMTPGPSGAQKPGIFDAVMALFASAAPPVYGQPGYPGYAQPGYPGSPYPYPPQSQGMSQNTMIALGLGAVGLLALVLVTTGKK